jgi:hypothetical protein
MAGNNQLERYESVLKRGARLVLTIQPLRTSPAGKQPKSVVEERWGVRLAYPPAGKSGRAAGDDEDDEDGELPRRTVVYFDLLKPDWRVIQATEGRPTAIERRLGGGTLVLVANAYLLSNEALVANRDSALLAAILGDPSRRYTFDEFHFGIAETGSLAALARKYGLQGFAAALLLLAALFIWQSASSFLPPRDVAEGEVLGKSAVSGFVNLLRRGVPPDQLLALCEKEWRKSNPDRRQIEPLAAGGGDPLAGYLKISRILAERKIR